MEVFIPEEQSSIFYPTWRRIGLPLRELHQGWDGKWAGYGGHSQRTAERLAGKQSSSSDRQYEYGFRLFEWANGNMDNFKRSKQAADLAAPKNKQAINPILKPYHSLITTQKSEDQKASNWKLPKKLAKPQLFVAEPRGKLPKTPPHPTQQDKESIQMRSAKSRDWLPILFVSTSPKWLYCPALFCLSVSLKCFASSSNWTRSI